MYITLKSLMHKIDRIFINKGSVIKKKGEWECVWGGGQRVGGGTVLILVSIHDYVQH